MAVEVTDDWYAQDQGRCLERGEYVANDEDGKVVDHLGPFEAGLDGAQAGIAMPAALRRGCPRGRSTPLEGRSPRTRVPAVTIGEEQVEVPYGQSNNVLMRRDLVPTEPRFQELEF